MIVVQTLGDNYFYTNIPEILRMQENSEMLPIVSVTCFFLLNSQRWVRFRRSRRSLNCLRPKTSPSTWSSARMPRISGSSKFCFSTSTSYQATSISRCKALPMYSCNRKWESEMPLSSGSSLLTSCIPSKQGKHTHSIIINPVESKGPGTTTRPSTMRTVHSFQTTYKSLKPHSKGTVRKFRLPLRNHQTKIQLPDPTCFQFREQWNKHGAPSSQKPGNYVHTFIAKFKIHPDSAWNPKIRLGAVFFDLPDLLVLRANSA